MDWFLNDNGLRHERVIRSSCFPNSQLCIYMDGQINKQTLVMIYCGRGKYCSRTNLNTNILLIEDFKKQKGKRTRF